MSECGFGLVVGKTYKVSLKPFDELLALGLAEDCDRDDPWYEDYLDSDVGLVIVPSQEEWGSVPVHWSTGGSFFYRLKELKILGEV